MLDIIKYNLIEFKEFVNSPEFNSFKNIPISTHRAKSYIENPRLEDGDTLLFIAKNDDEIIGYRTVLPDYFVIGNEHIKFAWFSGNWVHPAYRRKGISSQIMQEVFKTWNSKLAYTNYAPASKAVYDKSNLFKLAIEKQGYRLYFKSCLTILLPGKSNIFKRLLICLKLIDWIINIPVSLYYNVFVKTKMKSNLRIVKVSKIDINKENNLDTLTKRGKDEIDWITNFPWIKLIEDSENINNNYHFSSTAKSFSNLFYEFLNDKEEIVGHIMLKERDSKIDIPYLYLESGYENDIFKEIINLCFEQNAKILTFYHEQFVSAKYRTKLNFFFRKRLSRKYFISNRLNDLLKKSENINFQDGDGDCVFT